MCAASSVRRWRASKSPSRRKTSSSGFVKKDGEIALSSVYRSLSQTDRRQGSWSPTSGPRGHPPLQPCRSRRDEHKPRGLPRLRENHPRGKPLPGVARSGRLPADKVSAHSNDPPLRGPPATPTTAPEVAIKGMQAIQSRRKKANLRFSADSPCSSGDRSRHRPQRGAGRAGTIRRQPGPSAISASVRRQASKPARTAASSILAT